MGAYNSKNEKPKKKSKKKNKAEYTDEILTPFSELCRFADAKKYIVELDKPFTEFDNLIIKVINKKDGRVIEEISIDDIDSINIEAAKILNKLSKK